jgi:hypothetical protein
MNFETKEKKIKSQNDELIDMLNELSNQTKNEQNFSINIKETINNELIDLENSLQNIFTPIKNNNNNNNFFNSNNNDIFKSNNINNLYLSNNINYNNNNNNKDYILNIIEKNNEHQFYLNLIKNINLFKWLYAYNILSNNEIQNISFVLNKIKNNYSFECNNTIAEVKEIIINDCIQILNIIDINLNKKKLILISEDKIIDDNFLNIGDIIIFNINSGFQEENDFYKINIKQIQKLC